MQVNDQQPRLQIPTPPLSRTALRHWWNAASGYRDVLQLAWVGATPAVAAAASGSPIELPAIDARRDASGTSVGQPIAAVSTRYHA